MDTIDRLELMARRNPGQETRVIVRVKPDSRIELDLFVGKGVPLSSMTVRLRDSLEHLLDSEDAMNKDGSPWR